MKAISMFVCLLAFAPLFPFAQSEVTVFESTLKVASLTEETLEFGFAEGDEVIFSMREEKNKDLTEVKVLEWPEAPKFSDFKCSSIHNKRIPISSTGVYQFRFSNQSLAGRVIEISIKRIPGSAATQKFNTSVYWKTVNDTVWETRQEKYLAKSDTSFIEVMNQTAKVHSSTNLNGNKTTSNFTLPVGTVCWSYYVGVDQAGEQAYQEATTTLVKNVAPTVAKIPGYGPLAALALGGMSFLSRIQTGEDVNYYLVAGQENSSAFMAGSQFLQYKQGLVINDFARMEKVIPGMLYFCLYNDNAITPVSVNIRVTAVVVKQEYAIKEVKVPQVSSRKEPYLKG